MPLNQEDLSCKLLHKRRPVAVNSCIVIRGNNFGLPPLVMQQGWIVCHHTTQHQHAGASVLTPLLCLHALFGHLLCRLQEFLSHSQLPGKSCLGHFEVNCSSAAEMAPVSKATVPSPGFKRSHRKLPISLVSSCCRSTSPPVKLSFAGLFIPVMSRQGATGGLCCSPWAGPLGRAAPPAQSRSPVGEGVLVPFYLPREKVMLGAPGRYWSGRLKCWWGCSWGFFGEREGDKWIRRTRHFI